MDIIEKLKKIRNMINDNSLTEEERISWQDKYTSLKEQYKIEESQIEQKKEKLFRIILENKRDKELLYYIMLSYGMKDVYLPLPKESKNSFRLKCTQEKYDLIKDDFDYFKSHFELVLKAATFKFILSHVYTPEGGGKEYYELTPEELKLRNLMRGMDSIEDLNLVRKKSIGMEA